MISPSDILDLHARPSDELRQVMAHCAGILAHRHGDVQIRNILARLDGALAFHIPVSESAREYHT